MTNRERWIVYPLLFYALAMGFKATYQDPLEFRCRTIECQDLIVKFINGTPEHALTRAKAATSASITHAKISAEGEPESVEP
jgi:hypothetical protein